MSCSRMAQAHKVVSITVATILCAGLFSTPAQAATRVTNSEELQRALDGAQPGQTIQVAAGTYTGKFVARNNGNSGAPITLVGDHRDSVSLRTGGTAKGSGTALTIEGDWWVVNGITFKDSSKGVVLNGSNRTVLDWIRVTNIGDEGVHFLNCSSNNVLKASEITNTGKGQPGFGEGAYVGSSSDKWDTLGCQGGQDQSNNNEIVQNYFADTAAEGIDLKEGTYGGRVHDNTFARTGTSNVNSADSAIDVKGNYWQVTGNHFHPGNGNLDAIQTHKMGDLSNNGNTFHNNNIWGYWPGYGIRIHKPNEVSGVQVGCSNQAPQAQLGRSNVACS